jgi:hypothetical protein
VSGSPLAIFFANHLADGLKLPATLDAGLQQRHLRCRRLRARRLLDLGSPMGCHLEEERRSITTENRSKRRKLGVQDHHRRQRRCE